MKLAKPPRNTKRRFPIGAEVLAEGGVNFRVWAPLRSRVQAVLLNDADRAPSIHVELEAEDNGYFSGTCPEAAAGSFYGFRLDDDAKVYPDPASRYQPNGPHGPSQVIDASTFKWSDADWPGVALHGQVIYEMHIGTFTPEGTLAAATKRLSYLAELGVTVLEVMPVAEFDGAFGWGYDGVDLFAPTRNYGTPDDLRKFVDAAHRLGLGVILDVVYNHLGPSGNYLLQYSQDYFSKRHHTDWGDAINYDGENHAPVREFFLTNARYWIEEFHFDGLRVDAVHAVFDDSAEHVLGALGCAVRKAAGGRKTIVVVENEFQDTRLLRDIADSGCGMDGAWNDDFHHAARVALTGDADYYFGDYLGTPQELISAVKWGHLYQGQWNHRQQRQRGGITWGLKGECFVNFLQNHDQVGNSPGGERLHKLTSAGRYRAMTAVLMLAPGTPMLFQGQEYCASTPFHYFADHDDDFRKLVREGREKDCRKFRRLSDVQDPRLFLDPGDRAVFEACKLHHEEHHANSPAMLLHRDLIRVRKEDAVISTQNAERVHGAVLGPEAFAIRYFGEAGDDRLLVVNLGRDLSGAPIAEPLLAPSAKGPWEMFWTSEDPRYGGLGVSTWDAKSPYFHGHTAVLLRPRQS